MPLMPHRRTDERSAHEHVSAGAATNLWERDAVDWPVSGDETVRYQGRRAIRQASVDLWHAPSVAPKIKTTGIRVGDVIDTWQGRLTVTRVGSIAGFGIDALSGREVRWEIESVTAIHPA